jgi:hypothetical protein
LPPASPMAVQRRPSTPGTLSNVTSSEIEYCVAGGFDIRGENYRRDPPTGVACRFDDRVNNL